MIVGPHTLDDAGVVRLPPETASDGAPRLALVQTIDFFPPVVDDPTWYGRIAAANALSDVYAMGGRPLCAMNVVGFPAELPARLLGRILAGGAEKLAEAGAALAGGHSVRDAEIKYGLAVTGVVDPNRLLTNAAARAGDVLVLTKPIGMGTIATAMKKDRLTDEALVLAACEQMAALNRDAAAAALAAGAKAATDVTGFGLMGHGRGMAAASGVTIEFRASALPLFPRAEELCAERLHSGAAGRTRQFLGAAAAVDPAVPAERATLAFDAETSGGLLIAIAAAAADPLLAELAARRTSSAVVGRVLPRDGEVLVRLVP